MRGGLVDKYDTVWYNYNCQDLKELFLRSFEELVYCSIERVKDAIYERTARSEDLYGWGLRDSWGAARG